MSEPAELERAYRRLIATPRTVLNAVRPMYLGALAQLSLLVTG